MNDTPVGASSENCLLSDVVTTAELLRRPARSPEYRAENEALVALARELAESPSTILQKLTETAQRLCGAESAGISIAERDGESEIFRWHATSGAFTPFLGGTTPRNFSPCGVVLDRNATQLMTDPVRYYPYIAQLQPHVSEVLLIPFYRGDTAIGTVWIVAHNPDKHFDAEDARVLSSLSRFASAAVQTLALVTSAQQALNHFAMRKRAEDEVLLLAGQKEAQARIYRTALSNTPDLVYIFDLNGRFTYANDALLAMWGRTWSEAIGKNCLELGYAPDHAAMHDREIRQVITTRQPIKGEIPFTGTQGRRIYEYIFVPVIGADGQVEAVAGSTRDTTDRKRLEDELRRLADDLSEGARRKDEFLATLAHELRNPLAPIRNMLGILKQSGSDATTLQKAREIMDRQLSQMVRLIDDLLDLSRISRGKIEIKRERIELASVIYQAVEACRPHLESMQHELQLRLPDQPFYLDADPVRLAQVFGNLLNNACKYTNPGGQIELAVTAQPGQVAISVTDNGLGMPADMLPKIFEMFTQVDRTLERAQGGLGIGLTLVRTFVELHQGSVSVASAGLNLGSTFVVRLPLPAKAELPGAVPVAEVPLPATQRRILVVDDNRDSALSLAMLLKISGNQTWTAHDGLQALEVAESVRPDVILLDIGLPKMNGFDVCRKIREQSWGPKIRLIALTGWGQEEDRRKSQEAGFDSHLVKPVDFVELRKLLEE